MNCFMDKQTKIIATLSSNASVDLIKHLYLAGMNCVRINTAHQDVEQSLPLIKKIREVSNSIAILVDTKGPEVRTTKTTTDLSLKKGDSIKLSAGSDTDFTTGAVIFVNYPDFCKHVALNSKILIDDGEVALLVKSKTDKELTCIIQNDAILGSRKTVNVPGTDFPIASLSKKDKLFIDFAIQNKLDFIAHSFVRNAKDVMAVKKLLKEANSDIKVIAKIENSAGVKNLDEILQVCEGIMIARGDLGIEIPAEKVPLVQKEIIRKCRAYGKISITATQMLQSMITNPRPTRAEVSDVANAILDGTDVVMLSGETAKGAYPVECVNVMTRIALEAENSMQIENNAIEYVTWMDEITTALAQHAVEIATVLKPAAFIVLTRKGSTARLLSSFRSKTPIYAKCTEESAIRHLALVYGVHPSVIKNAKSSDEMTKTAMCSLVEEEKLKQSDQVILVGGSNLKFGANKIEIKTVKNICE